MEDQRDQDREPEFPAIFFVVAHLEAGLAPLRITPQNISTSGSLTTLPTPASHPGVMKQILLRVTAMFSKVRGAEFAELMGLDLPFFGKIPLHQDAFDPDIDRKRAQPF